MDITEMRKRTGLSQQKFADLFGMPMRTVQNWEYKKSAPPDYVISMMEEILKNRGMGKSAVPIKGEDSGKMFWYDPEGITLSDGNGTVIRLPKDLSGITDENLSVIVDDIYEELLGVFEVADAEADMGKRYKESKIEWFRDYEREWP